jgi:hypothetical protein
MSIGNPQEKYSSRDFEFCDFFIWKLAGNSLSLSLSLSLSAKAVPIGDLPNMTGNKFSKDFDMIKDTF